MPNTALRAFRLGILGLVCLLALTLAGITIHTIVVAVQGINEIFRFQIIALVAAVLSLIICPTSFLIGLVSKNSAGIWNVVELPNFGALAIIWLVAGIKTDQETTFRDTETRRKISLSEYCGLFDSEDMFGLLRVACTEFEPIKGIAFTCFALFLFYCVFTVALCVVAKARDSRRTVWKISSYNAHYFGIPPSQPQGVGQPQFQQQYAYPSQPQVVYAAPSIGHMYDPNMNQQVPVQMNPSGTPDQQPYVVYMQHPPPGMMVVPIPVQGQKQQLAPPPQSHTPASTMATATDGGLDK